MSVDKEMAPAVLVTPRSPDQEEILLIETSVVQAIAGSIEHELDRVKAARPSLASRVERAENIIAVHLSCRYQNLIKVRISNGGARFLVSGSKGAVYVVDPASWSCSCPDAHRHGKGCKHALACWALSRMGGPLAHRFKIAEDTPVEVLAVAEESGSYEVRKCSACLGEGQVYDAVMGAWSDHDYCKGTGRAMAFIYSKAPKGSADRFRECTGCGERYVGRDLFEVHEDHGSLTFFEGDELCGRCALDHGIL